MQFFKTFAEIVAAVFTAFGVYSAVQMLSELLFLPENIAVAITLATHKDAELADMLLHEAQSAFLRKGKARVIVLVSPDLLDGTLGDETGWNPSFQALLERYGAEGQIFCIKGKEP